MRNHSTLLVVISLLTGCGGMTASLDDEIVSSLQYDTVDCSDLIARRNALASTHGIAGKGDELQPGERPAYLPVGSGPFVPDLRGEKTRERKRAVGEVAAMDRSIERRCEKQ